LSATAFSSLQLNPALIKNLSSMGYHEMTPIQAQGLPPILQGKDVIAQAKTGSGKTATFGLGLLQALEVERFCVQSLVLCPTRELADQVAKEIRKLARAIHNIKVLTLCGGMSLGPQIGSLQHGAHIVVGTPGRVEELVRKGKLSLAQLKSLVLDEADRMLDMGFQAAVDAIIEKTPVSRQTLLFSATYPNEIQSIADRVMNTPVVVQTASTHDDGSIQQHFYQVDDNQHRVDAVGLLLMEYQPESAVVFCNTKRETQELATKLGESGCSALALHGDLEQKVRDQTLVRFANKSVSVLVATDVAARGLDISALDVVINFQIARDLQVHVHRIGRTGRAGSTGTACTLYHAKKEAHKLELLEEYLDQHIEPEPLPVVKLSTKTAYQPPMATVQIDGGKRQKLRPGDILGALTGEQGINGVQVGKIDIFDHCAYVAVAQSAVKTALAKLSEGKLKGRTFRVRRIRG
jgi:ATP-dependent RNA helicase DbpA